MVPKFVEEVLKFQPDSSHLEEEAKETENVRKKASIRLVQQMQRLLGSLIKSQKKAVDPSSVLNAMVDEYGNPMHIGDQKDVGEFNMALLARLEEGLKANNIQKKPSGEFLNPTMSSSLTPEELTQEGIVSNLFYGTQVEELSTFNENKEEIHIQNKSVFGQIIVQVEDKDLYSAWDKAYQNAVPEYQVTETFNNDAQQEIWIEKTPEMLLFQIQRVKYNKETEQAEKINDLFEFPKIIYPDRFMKNLKDVTSELRRKIASLRSKVSLLEEAIRKYRKFNSNNLALDKILEEATKYFESQTLQPNSVLEQDGVQIFDPLTNEHSEDYTSVINTLKKHSEQARAKLESMENQLRAQQKLIDDSFDLPQLKETPYHLHSILIHDGNVSWGHYYSYIYDSQDQIWRKYNDTIVSVVSEEQVMSEAVGGNGTCSAYCLVYIKETLLWTSKDPALHLFKFEDTDVYTSYLSPELLREIEEDNRKFQESIIDQNIGGVMKKVQDLYTHRLMLVNTQYNSKYYTHANDQTLRHELINFGVYLKLEREEFLVKWYLLDVCLREVEGKRLETIDMQDPFFVKLDSQFRKNCREAPSVLMLEAQGKEKLAEKQKDFFDTCCVSSMSVFLMENLLKRNFLECAYAVLYQYNIIVRPSEMVRFFGELVETFILRLTGEMALLATCGDIRGALNWGWFIAQIGYRYMGDSRMRSMLRDRIYRIKLALPRYVQHVYNPMVEKEMNDILVAFDGKIDVLFPPPNSSSQALEALKERLTTLDAYSWNEGWQHHSLASKVVQLKKMFLSSEFASWHDIAFKVFSNMMITNEFMHADRSIGILWSI